MKSYLFIFFSIVAFGVKSQQGGQSFTTSTFVPFISPDLTDVIGNPYLNEEWAFGTVITRTGTFDSLLLRYNVERQLLENRRGTHFLTFNRATLRGFILGDESDPREFRYIPQKDVNNSIGEGFVEVVKLGPESRELLVRHKKNLYRADYGPYSVQRRSEYRYEPTLLMWRKNKVKKVRLTQKFCRDTFGLSKTEVEDILLSKGISLNQ